MIPSQDHFKKAIASEAMRLMDEEFLSMDEAFVKAKAEFAGVPCCESGRVSEHLALAVPSATD